MHVYDMIHAMCVSVCVFDMVSHETNMRGFLKINKFVFLSKNSYLIKRKLSDLGRNLHTCTHM